MTKLKVSFLSSSITLVIVALTYVFIFPNSLSKKDLIFEDVFQEADSVKTSASVDRETITNDIYSSRRNIITETVAKVSPAIVGINVTEVRQYRAPWSRDPFWRQFFGSGIYNEKIKGLGSGAIISPDGYILTNDHVAGSANEIIVTLSDGTQHQAKVIGTDQTTDICLLKIDSKNLPFVNLGNSDDVIIGEWVIALGNPFGLFSLSDKPTVTVGVVSAVGVNLNPKDNRFYLNMIQTDASINQGNSGGPLVNSLGEVIGMNTIIYTAEGSSGNVGVGFAIPVNKIKKVIAELKTKGNFDRNYWTGLRIHTIDKGIQNYFNLPNSRGVIVTEVIPNSPGADAGLEAGDIIMEINDFRVDNEDIMIGVLYNYKTNETIRLKIWRNGNTYVKRMKLESR
ncbi:MAG: trypsin-like peptidase domain-containing protein [Bacteroidetes bacterium]|nr:trypsin-like peptidase domain-containing protein [Bacteroidota bacterium]MBU1677469.1 trypsin-like peptidase domain-containing protein [Bacteroidota bacterium]MBU2505287.1 trypsin-like peptidase domain-containing protein [Bacteroidota bacterium]